MCSFVCLFVAVGVEVSLTRTSCGSCLFRAISECARVSPLNDDRKWILAPKQTRTMGEKVDYT